MNVAILKPMVTGQAVATKLADRPQEWRELARSEREIIESNQKHARNFGDPDGYWEKSMKEGEARAKGYEAKAASIERFIANPPKQVEVLRAYALLKETASDGVSGMALEGVIKETRTKVDGKYTIAEVPAGSYYVYGFFGSRTNWIEWLVPVTVNPGENVEVDLFNDNAVEVKNL